KEHGLNPDLILAGRKINDSMPYYIFSEINRFAIKNSIKNKDIAFFGITYKENIKDVRNSKALELANMLKSIYSVYVYDPMLGDEVKKLGFDLFDESKRYHIIVFPVAHRQFKAIKLKDLKKISKHPCGIFDLKWLFNKKQLETNGFYYWSL
ncbi:MAG: hypothetical protein NZ870_03790, partial [bacterium]|nr:hypothetical protein [bacterium]